MVQSSKAIQPMMSKSSVVRVLCTAKVSTTNNKIYRTTLPMSIVLLLRPKIAFAGSFARFIP